MITIEQGTKSLTEALAAAVKTSRLTAGLTQAQLCEATGVSIRTLAAFESGKGNITSANVDALCGYLKIKGVFNFE